MGRLTDDLLAMVGLKPSDRVVTSDGAAVSSRGAQDIPRTVETGATETMTSSGDKPKTEDQESDCLNCRIVGSGTLTACAGYVVHSVWKNPRQFTGYKRVVFRIQGVCLSGVLLTLAVARAFNLGMFDPKRPKDLTVFDLAKADAKNISESIQRVTLSKEKSNDT